MGGASEVFYTLYLNRRTSFIIVGLKFFLNQALHCLTKGFDNVAIGFQAGLNCTTGKLNQLIGGATNTTIQNKVNSGLVMVLQQNKNMNLL